MGNEPVKFLRPTIGSILLGCIISGACTFAARGQAGPETQRPNIVVFHCHDLGQFLRCYGVKSVQTPNLDRFAAQGVRFARSFCTQPGCSPSRASLFTGRYPHNNGVMGLTHANFAWDLHPAEKHLAQFLKEAGYATVAVGVIHETRCGAKRCGYDKHINKAKAAEGTTAAIEQLRQLAAGKLPFYLYAGFIEPHRLPYPKGPGQPVGGHGFPGPHLKPDSTLGVDVPGYLRDTPGTREELAGLQGAVRHVDEQFGRWMQAIKELGLEEETLVIATTDHGIAMPRAKCSVYEPGLQIALLMRHAGRKGWHGGVVRNEMVSNIDMLPTILELVGIPVPANVQGRSFAPLLDGRAYTPNAVIFGELTYHGYYDPQRSVRTETHKLIANFSAAPSFQDPSQQWRPRSDTAVPEHPASAFHPHLELYDLVKDPWEQIDLANKPECAAIRSELAGRLLRHMIETDDPLLHGAVVSPQHETTLKMLQGEPLPK
ncbi:MAG: sulfatase [Planctomycetes bacterium]|nr:sulfatase [Planctomycetota bacterium]